jgi:hypothetical protein
MKKIYSILLLAFIATVFSCSDDSLDPLKTKEVKKGKLLALRGTQLDNLYNEGVNGAEFYPRVISGEETFDFDAEYLSDDPTSLESFDIYAIKKTQSGDDVTTQRIHLLNVPFSQFKKTADYTGPWVSVSIKLVDIFKAIGITDFSDPDVVDELLTVYQPGIDIESDLNLSDGSVLPSSEIIAQGLFESDQFYPAMRLVYSSVEFCPYEGATSWGGVTFRALEIYDDGTVSDFYPVTLEATGDNEYTIHGLGIDHPEDIVVAFTPAETTPHDQEITFVSTEVQGITITAKKSGGSYDQCDKVFSLQVTTTDADDNETVTVYQFDKPS